MRRVLLPRLCPAMGPERQSPSSSRSRTSTSRCSRGAYDTLTVYVFSKVRSGITPTINALALLLIGITLICAIWHEISRRRRAKRAIA